MQAGGFRGTPLTFLPLARGISTTAWIPPGRALHPLIDALPPGEDHQRARVPWVFLSPAGCTGLWLLPTEGDPDPMGLSRAWDWGVGGGV